MKSILTITLIVIQFSLCYGFSDNQMSNKTIQDTLQTEEVKLYHSKLQQMGVDIESCKCKSCRAGYTPLFSENLPVNNEERVEYKRKKRKIFLIGAGCNLYSQLENIGALSLGAVLFNTIYVGFEASNALYPNFRIYIAETNLYLTAKRSMLTDREVFKGGIGYEIFFNKHISIVPEFSVYNYEREWTEKGYSFDPNDGWFGAFTPTSVRDYHESHVGVLFGIKVQLHF
tara:strand:- start:462 stop:1148 length:687 start_codon:yes stop_codon:yes gene_type:complete